MANRYLTIERKFDAAHYLKGYQGACADLHGHTWKVVAKIKFLCTDSVGIALDFKILKNKIDAVLPDHKELNTWLAANGHGEFNPTAENLSRILFDMIQKEIKNLVSIEVWESDHAYATYEREE